jgi:hypothetical protein
MLANADGLHARVLAAQSHVFLPMEERWYRRNHEIGNREFVVAEPGRLPAALSSPRSGSGCVVDVSPRCGPKTRSAALTKPCYGVSQLDADCRR